ncbi:hypothetical protein GIB67_036984 [Kingdonia uniflora]|uniref:DNA-3-methyladenine glycosylase I n=1 Tax=Kingdonia uniflora TaxID=39325 RepID=A0A7J7NVV8_9MAGN|nr:hypothetical protein GIB67_036984 [Kingdonia uniflora]
MEENLRVGGPRVRSMNVSNSDTWTPAVTNKAKLRKPGLKRSNGEKVLKPKMVKDEEDKGLTSPVVCSILKRHEQMLGRTLSLDASCSSDASSDSLGSRASTGRLIRSSGGSISISRRKHRTPTKVEKVVPDSNGEVVLNANLLLTKRRCTWVTSNTDPSYAAFHDEEWGIPVHDDKKLFELLVLSGALAELPWPSILSKRHLFREVFADFDPFVVSKLNEKKISAPGSVASSLLSELKLRAIIENARQISKVKYCDEQNNEIDEEVISDCEEMPVFEQFETTGVIENNASVTRVVENSASIDSFWQKRKARASMKIINEFGSFDKYIWSFMNHKPVVSRFRYPRQVPVKTPKADVISKDLVRRGFRSVSPTVIYSFMQVAGITNDHLISCFRFEECLSLTEECKEESGTKTKVEKHTAEIDAMDLGLERAIAEMSISDEFMSPGDAVVASSGGRLTGLSATIYNISIVGEHKEEKGGNGNMKLTES